MNYEEAIQYFESNANLYDFVAMLGLISDDDQKKGLEVIQEKTACDDDTANLVWAYFKRKYGTKENNPIMQARENFEREQALERHRQRVEEYKYRNNAECPYCHSKNTKKISGFSKAGSVALFGVFAVGKVSKQWHCNQCKSDF